MFPALDAACARAFGEAVLYAPPGGIPSPIIWTFWERKAGSRLDELRKPHEGPIAEVTVSDIPTKPPVDSLFQAGARNFFVKKAEISRSGGYWIIELVEQFT